MDDHSNNVHEQDVNIDELNIHEECDYPCRSSIISQYIERFPDALSEADEDGNLPLHVYLVNEASTIDLALMMIEEYPSALEYRNKIGQLPLHIECSLLARSSVISKCIELYPEAITLADEDKYLPLHLLLWNQSSCADEGLIMMLIEKYPAALQHQNIYCDSPIHIECRYRCRLSIILKCMELYPDSLAQVGHKGHFPLHYALWNKSPSSINVAMMMINKYPAVLEHQNKYNYLPLHIECMNQCRVDVISRCIELYPAALARTDYHANTPLHCLLGNRLSTADLALMMIEEYPAVLYHTDDLHQLPIHIECKNLCRSSIISKCSELYPESLNDNIIIMIIENVNKGNFNKYISSLEIVLTACPMSLYNHSLHIKHDIRLDPCYRRRLLNLLPREFFTPTHAADYRNLHWQSRAAMMILLLQINIQQHNRQQQRSSPHGNMNAAL
jgi:ankyrin repeat protein